VLPTSPAQAWVLATNNLSTHLSRETQVALLAWPEVTWLFIPTYACWLHLRAPWWQPWRSLARKGRRFERIDEVIDAVGQATMYGHAQRYPSVWKKAA
jgi:hypothetical protein